MPLQSFAETHSQDRTILTLLFALVVAILHSLLTFFLPNEQQRNETDRQVTLTPDIAKREKNQVEIKEASILNEDFTLKTSNSRQDIFWNSSAFYEVLKPLLPKKYKGRVISIFVGIFESKIKAQTSSPRNAFYGEIKQRMTLSREELPNLEQLEGLNEKSFKYLQHHLPPDSKGWLSVSITITDDLATAMRDVRPVYVAAIHDDQAVAKLIHYVHVPQA
jgi:hypothetical protein